VAGVLGIILLVVGLVLSRARHEDDEYEDDDATVRASA
jgi:glucose uptake protein GlcU